MRTFFDLVNAVLAGARPHVTFTKKVEELEAYPEGGMKAAILDAGFDNDGVVWIKMDYEHYRAHNRPLEHSNYWDGHGAATLTCTEAGHYHPTERMYLMQGDAVSDYMVESTNELFVEFEQARGAGWTRASTYVEWLEEQVRQSKNVAKGGVVVG